MHIFRSSINTHRVRNPILNGVDVVPTSLVREPAKILAYTDAENTRLDWLALMAQRPHQTS
jgi:hypothetical protein